MESHEDPRLQLPEGWEWIEWTEQELDAVPEERWKLFCEGTYSIELARSRPFTEEHGSDSAWDLRHRPFNFGTVSQDRNGRVTLSPYFRESMVVDPKYRTVSFACRRCRFRHRVQLDYLVVSLTQTFTRSTARDGRPIRYPVRRVNVWEYYSLEPSIVATESPELRAEILRAFPLMLAIYKEARQPVRVHDRREGGMFDLP